MPNKPVISIVDDAPSVREGTMDLLNSMGFIAATLRRAGDFLKSNRLHITSCLIAEPGWRKSPGQSGEEGRDNGLKC
jgi:FixJ family two-component response regulator